MCNNKNSLILNISTNKINNYLFTIEYVVASQSSSSISTRVGHNEDVCFVLNIIHCHPIHFNITSHGYPMVGPGLLYQHNFEHNGSLKTLSIL